MRQKTLRSSRQRNNAIIPLVMITFFSLLGFSIAEAANISRFIMPGPLSAPHAKYENECNRCHNPMDQKVQRPLCLECHKKVAEDITSNTGFHGKERTVSGVECHNCHTEHVGRDVEIILFDMDVFDHMTTDFPLKSSHAQIKCTKCHLQGKKFRDAHSQCVSCHKEQEPHAGQLGTDCTVCHQEDAWKNFRFVHDKTKFPLHGSHEKLACTACHPNQQWKGLSLECSACHLINDIHNGRFGNKCDKCHSLTQATEKPETAKVPTSGWRFTSFDHATTRYPLIEKHSDVSCMQCHSRELSPSKDEDGKPVTTPCISCHQKSDEHKSAFGQHCENCHSPAGWRKTVFDHSKTRFPLKERHLQVPCAKCHTGLLVSTRVAESDCEVCHRLDDKHKGSLGNKCALCHTPLQWNKANFDHNKTAFVLQGKHSSVQCASCHERPLAEGKPGLSCDTCHLKRDVHQGQEGKQCEKCHVPQGWRENLFFDHDLTEFPLLGLHAAVTCESCHLSTTFKDASIDCKECHTQKDPHQNRLGSSCGTCHNPNGWKIWRFNHDTQSKFPLEGAHLGLDCLVCHQEALTKTSRPSMICSQCHASNDKHRGKFGQSCQRCHSPDSFKTIKLGK